MAESRKRNINKAQKSKSPKKKSLEITKIPWTSEEDGKLLQNVHDYLESETVTSKVTKSKGVFLEDVDWREISLCGDHTAEDAKQRFLRLSNKVRTIRTALEIVVDIQEEHKKVAGELDMPKRPITSFLRFIKDKKSKVKAKHPQLTFKEFPSHMGKKWRKLSDKKKEKYAEEYAEEWDEYNHRMVVYLKEHPHPDVKPPKSSYELWSTKEETKIKEDKPKISEKKLKKKLKRRWENMEDSERTKWNEKERKEINSYKKRIGEAEKKQQKK